MPVGVVDDNDDTVDVDLIIIIDDDDPYAHGFQVI